MNNVKFKARVTIIVTLDINSSLNLKHNLLLHILLQTFANHFHCSCFSLPSLLFIF